MRRTHTLELALGVAAFATALSCAIPQAQAPAQAHWHYFAAADRDDAWFEKIADWQRRERLSADVARPPREHPFATANEQQGAGEPLTLAQKYSEQAREERRELAQRFMTWSQTIAREHYRKDVDAVADPWPTSAELLAQGGDDCDGLDLLAYSLMREFGFERGELYRAIVRRERDRANHMVTLWFEDRVDPSDSGDPWVVDATGAVSLGMKRFSDLRGWRPTRVFDEHVQFSVIEIEASAAGGN